MTKQKKDFSNLLSETVDILTGIQPDPEALEPLPEKKEKKPVKKILLKMDLDDHAAFQKEARRIAAEENRDYSLTEFINDVLKDYRKTKCF